MAVYTHVSREELATFLDAYSLGDLLDYEGVTQGIENTNYFVFTSTGRYVLTLFEQRVAREDLPFFIDYMAHLSSRGLDAPRPIADRNGDVLRTLCDRPAIIISFLDGAGPESFGPEECRKVGALTAWMHVNAEDFAGYRKNALDLEGWRTLADKCRERADELADGVAALIDNELDFLSRQWPDNLPTAVVHADLFPDNIFFLGAELSGVIDFYFACTEAMAYDLAITLSAWAGENGWSQANALAMLEGYQSIRPLSDAERRALPILLRGAALRFLLTRLHDWLHQVESAQVAVKDPTPYRDLLLFHRNNTESEPSMLTIYTDGACSGNPGPGGWGVLIIDGDEDRELYGGEKSTTNNRMELTAAIEALRATDASKAVHLYTDSIYVKNGVTQWMAGWKRNGWKTSARKPVKNQDLWRELDEATQGRDIDWRWVKGHAGDPGNERADELARRGITNL